MRKIIYVLSATALLISCNSTNTENPIKFGPSYKEMEHQGLNEYLDTVRNIYSNYLYHVAFDAPDNWKIDRGVARHTIFRAYESDSSITFSINVIEETSSAFNDGLDIWQRYSRDRNRVNQIYISGFERQFDSRIENFSCQRSYIRNRVCLKVMFNTMFRSLDYEYEMTHIFYQTNIRNLIYTFGVSLPSLYYQENPEYYELLFSKIYFLRDESQ